MNTFGIILLAILTGGVIGFEVGSYLTRKKVVKEYPQELANGLKTLIFAVSDPEVKKKLESVKEANRNGE